MLKIPFTDHIIIHKDEIIEVHKLNKIFREYYEAQLDEILSGETHIRRNPRRVKPAFENGRLE